MKSAFALAAMSAVSAVNMEREPLLTWAPSNPGGGHPVNYFVPHFGEDSDITDSKKNVADSEYKLMHVLDTSDPAAAPPRNYFIPHFGEDTDITDSKKNLAEQEKKFGAWNLPEDEWF